MSDRKEAAAASAVARAASNQGLASDAQPDTGRTTGLTEIELLLAEPSYREQARQSTADQIDRLLAAPSVLVRQPSLQAGAEDMCLPGSRLSVCSFFLAVRATLFVAIIEASSIAIPRYGYALLLLSCTGQCPALPAHTHVCTHAHTRARAQHETLDC